MSFLQTMGFIERECRRNNGGHIRFSQGLEPTRTLIKMLPYTKHGICQALAAKWIAEHANDRSLWTWLLDSKTQAVKPSYIGNLMINFTESVARKAPLANPTILELRQNNPIPNMGFQDTVTTKYLEMWGLKKRSLPQSLIVDRHSYGLGPKTGIQLGIRLDKKWLLSPGGCYVLISILGPKGGHAMAAFVGQDIAFFDPNFGEFYFENPKDFRKWFQFFWLHSDYINTFDKFYLISYGVEIKSRAA